MVVAFVAGVVVQYITRLIFTFHYERMYRRIGGIFGGLSLTAIFYFLIMKGAKGASFMKPEYLAWINAHTLPILLVLFAGLSVVLHLLMVRRGVNIFKIVILAGTFALAFAFAGTTWSTSWACPWPPGKAGSSSPPAAWPPTPSPWKACARPCRRPPSTCCSPA